MHIDVRVPKTLGPTDIYQRKVNLKIKMVIHLHLYNFIN